MGPVLRTGPRNSTVRVLPHLKYYRSTGLSLPRFAGNFSKCHARSGALPPRPGLERQRVERRGIPRGAGSGDLRQFLDDERHCPAGHVAETRLPVANAESQEKEYDHVGATAALEHILG